MPSFSARPIPIAFVLFEGTKLIDVCGPLQVFSDAVRADGEKAYAVSLLSERGGPVQTDAGVPLATESFADHAGTAWNTVLVSGGSCALQAAQSTALIAEIKQIAPRCRRLASVCLGAFILAASGSLQGRRATTHWEGCDQLAADFDGVDVVDDAIYVVDGDLWTSAGVTCGIDMALAMVEDDLGRAEALRLAKSLVLPARRSGGQRQFSDALKLQVQSQGSRFASLIDRIIADPTADLSIPALAAMANMSERNFSRRFTSQMGISPARFVERRRVEKACELMHQSETDLKVILAAAGFSTAEQMRRSFQRILGVSPSAYRSKFG